MLAWASKGGKELTACIGQRLEDLPAFQCTLCDFWIANGRLGRSREVRAHDRSEAVRDKDHGDKNPGFLIFFDKFWSQDFSYGPIGVNAVQRGYEFLGVSTVAVKDGSRKEFV